MLVDRLEKLRIGYRAGRSGFKNDRPTLVMIHGAGGTSQVWQGQIHLLDPFLNTLALDLPGHGTTKGKGKDRIEEYADWLVKALDTLFEAPVFLMGHSMGGAIVQEVALRATVRLEGIILVGTGSSLRVAPALLEDLSKDSEKAIDRIISLAYSPQADPQLLKQGIQIMKEAGSKVLRGDFLACNGFDRTDRIQTISLPCLVICGAKDRLTPPKVCETLHEQISKSEFKVFPSSGHMVMIEAYDSFNECVKGFVSGIRARK